MTARKIGPFELGPQIGVGGMGVVYSAIYPKNGKTVAIKVLSPGLMSDPKLLKRFEREMEILKRLDHPNIVKYHGGGVDKQQRYYVMEFVDSGSLLDVLKKRNRLTWDQAIQVGRQVAAALEHAHNAGIIHRDLKPANLFLSKKGRLKLGDFGIARDTEATALTAAGKTVGTYAYMAPEQIQAGPAISRKTDLYALGCLLYEIIVGETPFLSENPMDMLMQHLQDEPYSVCEKVPECPIALDALIDELLAKNPDDRPYDALAVHTRLGEIRDVITTSDNPSMADTMIASRVSSRKPEKPEVTEKPKKKKKKKKKKSGPFHEQTWFLVSCLLVLLVGTIWLMYRGEDWYRDEWREQMQGNDYAQREARDVALKYLDKFPEGQYRDAALQVSDEVNARSMEDQLRTLAKHPRTDVSPLKEACGKIVKREVDEGLFYTFAWDDTPERELQSNPLPVMQDWRELIGRTNVDATAEDETRWLARVCENHHSYFRRKLIESPRAEEFLREHMLEAEQLVKEEPTAAVNMWTYVYDEFGEVKRLEAFAQYARTRIKGEVAEVPAAPAAPKPVVGTESAGDGE